jgi:hypothetical protein
MQIILVHTANRQNRPAAFDVYPATDTYFRTVGKLIIAAWANDAARTFGRLSARFDCRLLTGDLLIGYFCYTPAFRTFYKAALGAFFPFNHFIARRALKLYHARLGLRAFGQLAYKVKGTPRAWCRNCNDICALWTFAGFACTILWDLDSLPARLARHSYQIFIHDPLGGYDDCRLGRYNNRRSTWTFAFLAGVFILD